MIICVCHRVSDREFREFARRGLTFEDLQLDRGVATGCGRCESCARSLWQHLTSVDRAEPALAGSANVKTDIEIFCA